MVENKKATKKKKRKWPGAAPPVRRPAPVSNPAMRTALGRFIASRYPDYDPIVAMLEIATDPMTPEKMQFSVHKEIASYLYPKLKQVEITPGTGDGDGTLKFEISYKSTKKAKGNDTTNTG